MRVWTNGTLHVARSRKGLYVLRGSQVVRFVELPLEEPHRGLLAVDPSGQFAWLEGFCRVSLEDGSVEPGQAGNVLDAVGIEGGVAALLSAEEGVQLVLGTPGNPWSRQVGLVPGPVVRTDFPSALGGRVAWSWVEAPRLAPLPEPRSLRLRVSPAGIAVVCGRSGLIGVLRGDAPARWFQAPTGQDGHLDAVVTETGLLISLRSGEEGVAAHFSDDGRCEGHTGLVLQNVGVASLLGNRFVVFDGAKNRLKVFSNSDCQDLHPRSRLSLPVPPLDVDSSSDGRWVIYGGEETLSIFELGDKRLALVSSLTPESVLRESEAKAREKQRIEQGGHYKRPDGPPSLGFPVSKAPIPPWEAAPGETMTLALSLRSTGGVGQGVFVEISGPALDQGLVEPLDAELAGQKAPLTRNGRVWGCLLEAVELPQGMNFPFDPKPKTSEQSEKAQALLAATHLPFLVRLTCKAVGSSMLSVAAWPSAGSSAPMKWTRLLAVR